MWVDAIGAIFAIEGFLTMICWAISEIEGVAAGLSTLWTLSGTVDNLMCSVQRRKKKSSETADKADRVLVDSFEEDPKKREKGGSDDSAMPSSAEKVPDRPRDDSEKCFEGQDDGDKCIQTLPCVSPALSLLLY